MKKILETHEYNSKLGFKYKWEPNFDIEIEYENDCVILKANSAGLVSLANHLLNLSQENIPPGYHLHFDENTSLDDGSIDLIIQKK